MCMFDACDFFEFYKYQTWKRRLASEEWDKKVLSLVEAINPKHGRRLRAVFAATADVRNDFWVRKKQSEEQAQHKNALLLDVRQSHRDISKLAIAIVKKEVEDDLARRKHPRTPTPETESDQENSLQDIGHRLAAKSRRPLGEVLNAPTFKFEAMVGSEDLGTLFTLYYQDCKRVRGFHPNLVADIVEMQASVLGSIVHQLKKILRVPPRNIKAERAITWKDKCEDEQSQDDGCDGDDEKEDDDPRELAKRAIIKSTYKGLLLKSPQKMYWTLFSNFSTMPVSQFSEVNGMASFLCPFLTPLLQKPDIVTFSCANTITKASQSLQSLQSAMPSRSQSTQNKDDGMKRPDISGTFHKHGLEIYFGEISGVDEHSKSKIAIDLIRLAIWVRKSAERILHLYGVKVSLLGLQVIGQKITFYKFTWVGSILLMSSIVQMEFPTSLEKMEAIPNKVRVWAEVQEMLTETCKTLKKAKKLDNPGSARPRAIPSNVVRFPYLLINPSFKFVHHVPLFKYNITDLWTQILQYFAQKTGSF
ncbi:hypothetical protein BC939DRAFT_526365 [Gamsiella multidivaricata]|uniref:uncharacterized protein n=1 Tax=Gamsiella multidivaricata TaxID=101098 RepID=UPI0022211FB9|nr:uncharacterized protein BC939DRAFT_526365 [Gamsiella multidivaricata]KAI7828911.1 hypothetical protein BC939DRAFT_526365 [Gamsiella multidivaricata]